MMRTARKMILVTSASILFGYLLMVAVYTLPLDWPGESYDATISILKAEGMYPKDSFSNRQLDNYADSVSMLLASYPGTESPWRKAACNYYMSYDGEEVYYTTVTPYDYLIGNYDPAEASPGAASYARYWHGNLLLLKPLMRYFSYQQIRIINFSLIVLLTGIAIVFLIRRLPQMAFPFLITTMIIAPTAVGKTIEFSCVVFVLLLVVIILLGHRSFSALDSSGVCYLFLGAGIASVFVDFFTAPTLTLTIPLVLLCKLRHEEKRLLVLILKCCAFWSFGYIGMWAGKWLIAAMADGNRFLRSLEEAIVLRASPNAWATRQAAVLSCFKEVFSTQYLNISILIEALLLQARNILHAQKLAQEAFKRNLVFLIPILIPILWYILVPEHSMRHSWFAYRAGAGTVFAFLAALDLCGSSVGVRRNQS